MANSIPRFPHIALRIFEQLDNKSLTNCREVSRSWQKFIDDNHLSWIRIVKIPSIPRINASYQKTYKCFEWLFENSKLYNQSYTYLNIAAKTGQTAILEMILEDEEEKENINHRDIYDATPLHNACENGNSNIVKMLLKTAGDLNIDVLR